MRPAAVPSPATLGLTRPHAAQDIEQLGWKNPESVDLSVSYTHLTLPTILLV